MSWFVAQLRCPKCDERKVLDKAGLANWLKERGRMRRETKPDVPLMLELGKLDAVNARCGDCGAQGLCLEPAEDDDEDWGDVRRCETCKQEIDPLRLEVFPDSTLCTECQRLAEAGHVGVDEMEFCPKCGAVMQVQSQQRGVTRYQLVCTECRHRC